MIATVSTKKKKQFYTLEAYLRLEEKTLYKNEFRNGKIIPMADASINHNLIVGNIFGHLPIVEVLFKSKIGWIMETYIGLEETIKLQSIDCELKMADIYEDIEGLHQPQGKLDLEQEEQ